LKSKVLSHKFALRTKKAITNNEKVRTIFLAKYIDVRIAVAAGKKDALTAYISLITELAIAYCKNIYPEISNPSKYFESEFSIRRSDAGFLIRTSITMTKGIIREIKNMKNVNDIFLNTDIETSISTYVNNWAIEYLNNFILSVLSVAKINSINSFPFKIP